MHSMIGEEIAFTPFNEKSLDELKRWLENDQSVDIISAFGNSVIKESNKSVSINEDFLHYLLYPEDKIGSGTILSMMVTIRTSYHSLINIGYIQLSQVRKEKGECAINYLYIAKAYRHKDYEYLTFQRIIEFILTEMHCERCFIWIGEWNYLFLSLAKTLNLKLIRIGTDGKMKQKRYCYVVGRLKNAQLDNYLLKKCAINISSISQEKMPDISIPDYIDFKSKLKTINKVHEMQSSSSRKTTAYYSPIIKSERYVVPKSGEQSPLIKSRIKAIEFHSDQKDYRYKKEKNQSIDPYQMVSSVELKPNLGRIKKNSRPLINIKFRIGSEFSPIASLPQIQQKKQQLS